MASHQRMTGSLQTKALAGLVALLLAAAVIALVVVTNNGGSGGKQAGAGSPSDVGRTSSAAPSHSVDASSTAAPTTSAPTSVAPVTTPATTPAKTAAPSTTRSTQTRSITYTVKKGDNLTVIAAWFHEHGYGNLYDRNKSVIGGNPDLIYPGEKITITDGTMTTSGS